MAHADTSWYLELLSERRDLLVGGELVCHLALRDWRA
jgi:hypothetical protein